MRWPWWHKKRCDACRRPIAIEYMTAKGVVGTCCVFTQIARTIEDRPTNTSQQT